MKFPDKIHLENPLFVSESPNNLLSSLFCDRFIFSSDQYNYGTLIESLIFDVYLKNY